MFSSFNNPKQFCFVSSWNYKWTGITCKKRFISKSLFDSACLWVRPQKILFFNIYKNFKPKSSGKTARKNRKRKIKNKELENLELENVELGKTRGKKEN